MANVLFPFDSALVSTQWRFNNYPIIIRDTVWNSEQNAAMKGQKVAFHLIPGLVSSVFRLACSGGAVEGDGGTLELS